MDLRKVERELEGISSDWNAIRMQRPRLDDGVVVPHDPDIAPRYDIMMSSCMPTWVGLFSGMDEHALFPPEEEDEEEGCREEDGNLGSTVVDPTHVVANHDNDTTTAADDDDDGGGGPTTTFVDSEFGMCLVGTSGDKNSGTVDLADDSHGPKHGNSIWEKYAARNARSKDAEPPMVGVKAPSRSEDDATVSDYEKNEPIHAVDVSPETLLAGLESLHERFVALRPRIEKFKAKLRERDPVTKKPRYGEKTIPRVKAAIRSYKALEGGLDALFNDTDAGLGVVSALRLDIQRHCAQLNDTIQARRSQEQLEAERLAGEMILAKERANRERLLVEQRKRDEERELARRAEEARIRRFEEEQAAIDAERRADRELLAMVPTLGADGVREQIDRMREALRNDRAVLDVALGSLYTLFEQIVRKPEEANFRRVRRNHPKFMEDIGRHIGGREVLIAAGFRLEKLDGVPCFFSAEPHIETDMDGWSEWFDTLKKTLAVIEEEMIK